MAMYSLLILFIILLLPGGGYFTYAQAAACVVESALLLGVFLRKKSLRIKRNGFFWGMLLMTGMYILVPFWSIDRGLAWFGALRALSLFLFLICLWQCEKTAGEQILKSLPHVGAVMSVLSLTLLLAGVLPGYVSVAGRLAGTFQYPNTMGIFLLLGFIEGMTEFFSGEKKPLTLFCSWLCFAGVIFTRSRGVYGLAALTLLAGLLILWKQKAKSVGGKTHSPESGFGAIAVVLALGGVAWKRGLFDGILSSSTLWGRLLYDWDALKILGAHPLGLGYYGYYYLQGSVQTGAYAVAHVHNEYLQLAVDIGILPAVVILGCWIVYLWRSAFFRKDGAVGRKLMLGMLCLHLLVDYDMQFLTVGMVFVCLMDGLSGGKAVSAGETFGRKKMPSGGVLCVLVLAIIFGAVRLGGSDAFCIHGDVQSAIRWYPGNTLALDRSVAEAADVAEGNRLAERILKKNTHDAVAYEARAFYMADAGDFDHFIYYQKKAMETRPYDEAFRLHYLTLLNQMVHEYLKAGQLEEAALAYEYMAEVPVELEGLKKRTSTLGLKIKDKPPLTLPREYKLLLKADRRLVYGK